MLSILLLIPLVGALLFLILPSNLAPTRMRSIAIAVLVVQLIWSLRLLFAFDPEISGMQLQESYSWVEKLGLRYELGIDGLSLPLVLLNAALTLVAAVCTRELSERPRLYFALILLISCAVNGAFVANNLLFFLLFYELELIPLWLLILIWGGAQRVYAATKFLLFTALSGVLILAAFLSLTVIVLLLPLMFQRLNPVAGLSAVNSTSIGLVVASGALGVLAGSLVRLDRFWSRSVLKPLRALQDLLAYDFYTDKLYRATIVRLVAGFADLTNRFDQEVITGLANRLGLLSMQGAQGLKLAVSGQMQTYVLTAVLAIVLLLGSLIWSIG